MRYNLQATGWSLDLGLKEYVGEKIEKLDDFVREGDTSAFADIEIERRVTHSRGEEYRAEFTVHSAGAHFRAEAVEATPRAAFDVALEKLSREMRGKKRKGLRLTRLQGLRFKGLLRGWPFRRK